MSMFGTHNELRCVMWRLSNKCPAHAVRPLLVIKETPNPDACLMPLRGGVACNSPANRAQAAHWLRLADHYLPPFFDDPEGMTLEVPTNLVAALH